MMEGNKVSLITVNTKDSKCNSFALEMLDELLLVTCQSVIKLNLPVEQIYLKLSIIKELEKVKHEVLALDHSFRINSEYAITLHGNAFSALVYLLQNNTFRNGFLVQMSIQSSQEASLPCMNVRLIMPEKSSVGYRS